MADDPTELELLAAKDDFRAKDRLAEVRQDVSNSVMQGGDAVSAALEQARKDLTDAEERAQITYGGFQPETLVGMEVVQLKTKITLLKRAMQEMDSGPTSQIGVVSSYQKIEERPPGPDESQIGDLYGGAPGGGAKAFTPSGADKTEYGDGTRPEGFKDETGFYDDGHTMGWQAGKGSQEAPAEAPSGIPADSVATSGWYQWWITPKKAAVAGGALVLIASVVIAVNATGGGGGGGNKPAPTPPVVASTPVFFAPTVLQLPASLTSQLQGVAIPPDVTTDPNGFGEKGALLTAYQQNGMLLHQSAFVFRVGLDPAKEDSWPPGVSGSDNFGATFFQTHEGAVAVERASEANLVNNNFHKLTVPDLERQGIAAFEPVAAGAAPLNQIWYAVDGNAFLAIADTGRFLPATFRPQEQALFNGLEGLLRPAPSAPSSPLSQAQSQQAYESAVAPVNAAAPAFYVQAQRFGASTTNAQAQAAAQPLVAALDGSESQLLTIAAGYAPGRADIYTAYAAADVLKADLSNLARLDKIGVSAWARRYDADLAKLTAASNTVRSTLGLPATRA